MDKVNLLLFMAATAIVAPVEADSLEPFQFHIDAASQRFDLPAKWIEAVIEAESNGDPRALSATGAMGLMQLMPDTWAEMRDRYGLGTDPFVPQMNILAGTAYLKAMYDRFGYPGLFAAYNAGPGRYEEHRSNGKRLPGETRAYVARIEKRLERADKSVRSSSAAAHNLTQMHAGSDLFFPNCDAKDDAGATIFVPLLMQKARDK
ncbi:lytic transglycosylase domain-containing protein [Roseibium aggregatum]|uniref:Lytic transglycosylase domain-containing protein n=1 Tax=Roseibium aggregatum TaxID=187304 RepID=A0A926P6J6_9HYPH|nr:lytic transglycosylase domain-containing protein [Roseibium aggregatum]MBD1549491.1 lytic transglycosylase domain-containing protein [Roseibium aggregatum]